VGSSPSAGNEFSIQWSMADVQRSPQPIYRW
jgi:hypothetical protein